MEKIFKNKKVVIMGLGLHGGGLGSAKFFCKQGAQVLVTDLKTEKQLAESLDKLRGLKITYRLGGHKEEDFKNADLIVKNPDVPDSSPYLEIARKNNVPVETDLTLFFELSKAFIIGVTGTKGKSTTASLIYHLLKPKYKRIFLAGNIGVSALELLPKIKQGDIAVLELSSFELESLKKSPNIAVVTNILPDHLNRYASMSEYINAKKLIFKYQSQNDKLVLNSQDPAVKSFKKDAKSQVYFFSSENSNYESMLLGSHNKQNISAAAVVAKLMDISDDSIKKSLKNFKGVHSRLELIRELKGVKYYNDTTATMPNAVLAAINSLAEEFPKSKIILIAGGQNKNLEFSEFCKIIKEKVFFLVMLPGTASEIMKENLQGWPNIQEAQNMKEAVLQAQQKAGRGDIVLLSPGAASFNLFKNEFDRGSQFVNLVKRLK